ncbi:hypothetical protein ACHQM5_000980 [Ranunculus cassubicifolius]
MHKNSRGGRKWGEKGTNERGNTGKWVWKVKDTKEKGSSSNAPNKGIPKEDGDMMLTEQMSLMHLNSWKLPQDITFDIISRLSVKFVMRCRCVSKTWRAWLSNQHFINLHLIRAARDNDRSLLLTSSSSTSSTKIKDGQEYPCIEFKFRVHLIESMHDLGMENYSVPRFEVPFHIRAASCNGLLCSLVFSKKTALICNPFTGETLELSSPDVGYEISDMYIGFGYHPRTKEYKILCFAFVHPSKNSFKSLVEVQTLGSNLWRSKGEVPTNLFYQPFNVLVNGALHWLASFPCQSESVVISSFDIADEEFRVLQVPAVVDQWENKQVQELDGFLSLVGYSSRGLIEVWIMKNYGAEDSWSKQFIVSTQESVETVHFMWKLEDGTILIQYNGSFIAYDPNIDQIRNLPVQAPPRIMHCVAHVGSLLSPRMEL